MKLNGRWYPNGVWGGGGMNVVSVVSVASVASVAAAVVVISYFGTRVSATAERHRNTWLPLRNPLHIII